MPLVAMTREMGSLGKDVAKGVAEALGTELVYHEIIDQLADKMRVRKSHVVRLLDGKASILERLTADKTSLSIYTADETFRIAERPRGVVIRGWGATQLLRPVGHAICVRVCAPLDVRVQRMMERLNTDDEDFVRREIEKSDEAQSAIIHRHFGINWQEPEHYDLTLNTERVPIDECTDEVLKLVRDDAFRETEATQSTLANLSLAAHVRAALRLDPRTRKVRIMIEAARGEVTLSGILDQNLDLEVVAGVAAAVPGVKSVKNNLKTTAGSRFKDDY